MTNLNTDQHLGFTQTYNPRKSVIVLIILNILTLGIYFPIWAYKHRNWMNSLNSKLKLKKSVIIAALILIIVNVLIVVSSLVAAYILFNTNGASQIYYFILSNESLLEGIEVGQDLLSFILALLSLNIVFDMRSILNKHFNTKISFLGTLFFSLFYIQYKINELTKEKTQSINDTQI